MYLVPGANRNAKSEKAVSIQLCNTSGEQESVVFDSLAPLDEQMDSICRRFQLDYDDEENYYVLTSDANIKGDTVQVLRRTQDLVSASTKKQVLGLWLAADLVQSRLDGLEELLQCDNLDKSRILKQFEQLFSMAHLQEELLWIIAETHAIEIIWQAVLIVGSGEPAIVDMTMGLACLLIGNQSTVELVDELLVDEECPDFFRVLLEVLATLPHVEDLHIAKRPYATLAFITAVLEGVEGCASVVHMALEGAIATEDEPEIPSMYAELVNCVLDGGEDQFLSSASSILLHCLCLRAQSEGENGDADLMYGVMNTLEELDRDDREEKLWDECTDPTSLATEFVFLQTYSAADIAAISARKQAGSDDKESQLERRLTEMTKRKDELEKMVKKLQTTMQALAPFVTIGEPRVQSAVEQVLKFGWDALEFKNGYSILHYAGDKVPDPLVAELLFHVMPHPEASDQNGMTALDYAKQAGNASVVSKLMQLSPVFGHAGAVVVGPEVSKEELRGRLAVLPGVSESIKAVLAEVVEKGWHEITWPGGFTALHLAAQKGNVEILDFCMAAGAAESLTSIDQYQCSPMHYALQREHLWMVQNIQEYLDAEKRALEERMKQHELAREAPKELPSGTDPKLRAAVSAVLDRGWARMKWPNGYTALHLAAAYGSAHAIKALLEASAEPGLLQRDNYGKMPLAYAEEKNWGEEILDLLRPKADAVSANDTTSMHTDEKVGPAEATDAAEPQVAKTEPQDSGSPAWSLHRYMADETFLTYLDIFQNRGTEQVIAKLTGPKLTGGLELTDVAALDALEQVKFVAQMIELKMQVEVDNLNKQGVGVTQRFSLSDTNGVTKAALNQMLGDGTSPFAKPARAPQSQQLSTILEQGAPAEAPASAAKYGKGRGKAAGEGGDTLACIGTNADIGKLADEDIGTSPGASNDREIAKGGGTSKGKGKGKSKGGPKAPGGQGGGGGRGKPTKPIIEPAKRMQALWWGDPLYFGGRLKSGMIWDNVPDQSSNFPVTELTLLFTLEKDKTGGRPDPPAKGQSQTKEKAKEMKVIEIIDDQKVAMQASMALQAVPPSTECAQALDDLDDEALTPEHLEALALHACPNQVQLAQLKDLREKHPELPMGMPEEYMWIFGHMKRARERLEIWSFVRSAEEPIQLYSSRIREFESICDAVLNSKALRSLFGLILAVGNYMNGGTSRGRYDGFHVEKTLDQLTTSKDKNGHALAMFVLKTFADREPEAFKAFIAELQPVFLNIARRIKQLDGSDYINKNPRISLEDYDPLVNGIQKQCDAMQSSFGELLKEFKDATDPFKLRMPAMLRRIAASVNDLVKMRDDVKSKYASMLNLLGLDANMKGTDFCILFDDFMVPNTRLLAFEEATRSRFIVPAFCADRSFTSNDVLVLWGIKPFEEPKPKHESRKDQKNNKEQWKKKKKAAAAALQEGPINFEVHHCIGEAAGEALAATLEKRRVMPARESLKGAVVALPRKHSGLSHKSHKSERTWRSQQTRPRRHQDEDEEKADPNHTSGAGHKAVKRGRKFKAKVKPIKEGLPTSFTSAGGR